MKSIAIHQPNYIPWLGYFYKIYQSDAFVFLDNVQFSNKGLHDYQYIKSPGGRYRMRIPVKYNFGDNISDVLLNEEINWASQHLRQLEANYKRAPFFREVYSDFESLYASETVSLAQFNAQLITFVAAKFGLSNRFVFASGLNIEPKDKNGRIISVCKALEADVYYSGTGAAVYQDSDTFHAAGVELRYSVFQPFPYPQLWGEFDAGLSVVDYLMNCGYDWQRVLDNQKSNFEVT